MNNKYVMLDANTQLSYLYNKKRQGLTKKEVLDLKKYLFANGIEPNWIPDYLLDKEWLAEYFDRELE